MFFPAMWISLCAMDLSAMCFLKWLKDSRKHDSEFAQRDQKPFLSQIGYLLAKPSFVNFKNGLITRNTAALLCWEWTSL